MGGIGFQKTNGDGSKMQELINLIGSNVGSSLRSEAIEQYGYKKALKFKGLFTNDASYPLPDAYGRYNFSIFIENTGVDNTIFQLCLKLGGEVVVKHTMATHGADLQHRDFEVTGKFDEAEIIIYNGNLNVVECYCYFNGYKFGQSEGFIVPPPTVVVNPNADGNVHLSVDDLTSLGYTYQWNVLTGTGEFVNPNVPDAVFTPDGNGDYELELVVNEDELTSTPVVSEVTIDFANTILIDNVGGQRNATINLIDTYSDNAVVLLAGSQRKLWQPYKEIPEYRQCYVEVLDVAWNTFNKLSVFKGAVQLHDYDIDSYSPIPQIGLPLLGDDYTIQIDSYTREEDEGLFITFDGVHADNAVILNMSYGGHTKHYAEGNWLIPYGYLLGAESCYIGHQFNEFDVYDNDNVLIGSSVWVAENNRHEYTLLNLVSSSYKVTLK